MSIFDGNNPDLEAAEIGGVIGFAEESLELEDSIFKENGNDDNELELSDDDLPFDMRAFKAQYPEQFKYVIKHVLEYHKHRKKIKQIRDEIMENEFYYELEDMEKSMKG